MINRRNFLKQSSVLISAAGLGLPSFAFAKPKNYKMGLQLYTIRDAMAKDTIGTLKSVALLATKILRRMAMMVSSKRTTVSKRLTLRKF